ncbi:MAG: hypothetical protein ACE5GW_03350, partial [Planctomycetota bacterium]
GHERAVCLRCHNDRGPVAAFAERGCGGCHADPHKSSLGLDCERCHGEANWQPQGLIAEHANTRFPLFGAHVAAPCEGCHERSAAGDFRGASIECEICHARDLARTTSPDHVASGLTTDCERCHSPMGWGGSFFKHAFFPLAGGHAGHPCTRCHQGDDFSGLSAECYSCHQGDYSAAPNHASAGFSHACQTCHTIYSWETNIVNHDFFPLVGGHSGLSCIDCHIPGTFSGLSTACFSCHADDYANAPGHVASGFSQNCENCHNINSWASNVVNHDFFPLTGGHSGLNCTACHFPDTFGGLTTACVSCHQNNYNNAPSHIAMSFPLTCEDCHNTGGWGNVNFNHSFPLTGPHDKPCMQCHTTGNTNTFNCLNCHQPGPTNDHHSGVQGYIYQSQACFNCHPNGDS